MSQDASNDAILVLSDLDSFYGELQVLRQATLSNSRSPGCEST